MQDSSWSREAVGQISPNLKKHYTVVKHFKVSHYGVCHCPNKKTPIYFLFYVIINICDYTFLAITEVLLQ